MHVVDHVQFVILNCTEITLRSFIFSKSNNNIYTSGIHTESPSNTNIAYMVSDQ